MISALVPRWWLAALCSVALTIFFIVFGEGHFSFLPDMPDDSMSIGFGLSTGNAQWVTISRALKPAELNAIAQWWPWPLVGTLLFIALFCTAVTLLYDRKELRG